MKKQGSRLGRDGMGTWGKRRNRVEAEGVKIINKQCVHVSTPQAECNQNVLQTYTNKIFKKQKKNSKK